MATEYAYIPLVKLSEAKKKLAVRKRTSVNRGHGSLLDIRSYEEMDDSGMHEYKPPVSRWAYSMSIPYDRVPEAVRHMGENRVYEYMTGIHLRKLRRVRRSVTHNEYEVKESLRYDTERLDEIMMSGGAVAIPMYPTNPVLSEDALRVRNSAVRIMRSMRIKREHMTSFIAIGVVVFMMISVLTVKADMAKINYDNNRIIQEMDEIREDIDAAKVQISFGGNIKTIQERAAALGMMDSLEVQIVDVE